MRSTPKIKITVLRAGLPPEDFEIEKDSTIETLLKELHITLDAGESVWVGGEKAGSQDKLDEGDVVNVVASKEGGK